jgi:hypothetical protein
MGTALEERHRVPARPGAVQSCSGRKIRCLAPTRHARSRTCFGAYDRRARGKRGGLPRVVDDLRQWVQGKMEQPDKIRFAFGHRVGDNTSIF